jgi:hypothetical protein
MTAQIRETLILNGERTTMDSWPPLPLGHPRVAELTNKEMTALKLRSRKRTRRG